VVAVVGIVAAAAVAADAGKHALSLHPTNLNWFSRLQEVCDSRAWGRSVPDSGFASRPHTADVDACEPPM
jgi:hypothetical protein